ncbi:MAG: FeoA domain-containing protein [Pseudomonadota bacterium]
MNTRHEHEKKQFRQLFRQEGVDDFDKRFQILDAFLKTENHVTCQEIVQQLEREGFAFGLGFVAETMELLCRFGFAHRMKFDDGAPLYEHRHLGLHHDHMVCTRCAKIIEFKDDVLEEQQLKLTAAYGFHMLQHKMEIYGICSECQEKRSRVISLDKAKPGEHLVISDLEGGKNSQMRLMSMGLRIGDAIEVFSVQGGGQMVIEAGGSRYVIGGGLAEKIMVRPSDILTCFPDDPETKVCQDTSGPKMLLSDMKQGQEGTVVRVAGESLLRRRILEMGINRGATVYVEKYAPLRDPVELIVKGYHVSLRVEEAAHICVENVRTNKSR